MIKVLINLERFDKHVLYVNFHGISKVVCEHLVDQLLVGHSCILHTERHDLVAKDASFDDECILLKVIKVHEELAVA